jgi:hypothetical protein
MEWLVVRGVLPRGRERAAGVPKRIPAPHPLAPEALAMSRPFDMQRVRLEAQWLRWSRGKHNHPWAWSLSSACPACRITILKEVRLWN